MGLLSNLKARFDRAGIRPNVTITPKLTRPLLREPKIELPQIPRRRVGLPPRTIVDRELPREILPPVLPPQPPVATPVAPFVPPIVSPVQSVTTPQPIGRTPRPVQEPVEMTPVQLPNLATGELETVNIGNYNLPTGPVSPPTNRGVPITDFPVGGISAVPQEPIELETGPVTIGGPRDLGGMVPPPSLSVPQIGNFRLQKMPVPPKRDDFMSIGGPGGGFTENRVLEQQPFVPPQQPVRIPLSERIDIYGAGKRYDPANLPEGFSFQDTSGMVRDMGMPPAGFVYAYGPDGERRAVPSGEPGAAELRNQPPLSSILGDLGTRQPEVGDGMTEPSLIGEPTITPEPVTTSAPVTPAEIVTPPEPVTPPASTTVAANQPTETTAPANVSNQNPFASSVRQVASGLDPLTEQLLFGVGGQGGFIPGAMRAAERTFYDEEGNPIVIDEQVAGFSPDQISAIEMQRQSLGLQDPYIQDARSALQASMQAYDPSITGQFFNPFEDRVVQQTIQDVMEQGAKSDIGALAGDIARGGQSAFGSRARLGAAERQEALGRGLSEALGSLRARGFSEAQRAGMGEFARQTAAQRAGASGLASLGAQAAGASLSDIGALYGMGTQQQTQAQRMLDAQRRNLQQRQMTPLLQYQALQPFVSMAPAGQFQTITDFTPRPSAMMTGIGTGLSAFGSLGNLYGGK